MTVMGSLAYASASMTCAPEIPGYNGTLYALDEAIKNRIESSLDEASAAIAELIEAVKPFNSLISGRSIPDSTTVHRVDVPAMAFYRLQEAVARVTGDTK